MAPLIYSIFLQIPENMSVEIETTLFMSQTVKLTAEISYYTQMKHFVKRETYYCRGSKLNLWISLILHSLLV